MSGLFRSFQDASAPILGGNLNGSLIEVLKAVLVNGYGATAALGWEIAFEDAINHVCVFRPLSGNLRPFVRVDDNGYYSGNTQYSQIMVYESMSDADNGFFPCPDTAVAPAHYLIKSMYNSSSAIPWYVIGDDRGFWFLTRGYDQTGDGSGTGDSKLFFFGYIGEYPCNNLSNTYNCMTLLCDYTGSHNARFNDGGLSNAKLGLQRDPETMDSGAVHTEMVAWYARQAPSVAYYTLGIGVSNCSPKNGQYFYEPVIFKYNKSFTIGTVPGLFNMIWQSPTYDGSGTWYRQSEDEMLPFFDGDMFVFPIKSFAYMSNSVVGRMSILTGANFRNAY